MIARLKDREETMNQGEIDVSGIDPAVLLAALYNRSFVNPSGLGVLQEVPGDMTLAEAQEYIGGKVEADYSGNALMRNGSRYFDYLRGRVMKVEINGKALNPDMYDRDLGEGAAQRVVDALSQKAL